MASAEPAVDRMAPILDCLPNLFQTSEREAGPDEYVGKDGLIHCAICGEPREAMIAPWGKPARVPAMCRCQNMEYDVLKRKNDEEIQRMAIRNMSDTLFGMGVALKCEARFSDVWDENDKYVIKAKKYAENFDMALERNISLLLMGVPGCGKTFLAECIANHVEDSGKCVLMTNVQRVADGIRMNYGESKAFILSRIRVSDLLILDDFGTERDTSYMTEVVFDVINERYTARKPFIITTNLTMSGITAETDMRYKRIYDRILETAVPMTIEGTSKRKVCASRNREYWADLFE